MSFAQRGHAWLGERLLWSNSAGAKIFGIEKKVIEKVQDFLAGLDDKNQFGALIVLVVTLLPVAINKLIGAVGKLLGDEQFPVFAAGVAMDAPDALFAGGKTATPEAVAQFSAFDGTYKVHHEFALS